MAEQNEYEQYAPVESGRMFNSAMFGFNKQEVLNFLADTADENLKRQQAAEAQIRQLTQRLQELEAGGAAAGDAPPDAAAAEQLERARIATEDAQEDVQLLREELRRSKKESGWLRTEYEKLANHNAELHRQLESDTPAASPETDKALAAAQQELEQLRQRVAAEDNAKDQLLAAARAETARAQAEIEALRQQLAAGAAGSQDSALLADTQRQLEAARQETQRMQQEMATLRGEATKAAQQAQQLETTRQQLARAQAELAEARASGAAASPAQDERLAAAQQELARLQTELAAAHAGNNDLRRRLEEARTSEEQLAQAQNEIETLRRQLQQMQMDTGTGPAEDALHKSASILLEEANHEARRIRDEAEADRLRIRRQLSLSAGSLEHSIQHLRTEVTQVGDDVAELLESVQIALTDVMHALGRTEQELYVFDRQVERFPAMTVPVEGSRGTAAVPAQRVQAAPAAEFTPVSLPAAPPQGNEGRLFRPSYSYGDPQPAARTEGGARSEKLRNQAESLVDTLLEMLP